MHVHLRTQAASVPKDVEKTGYCLCKTAVSHLWKGLETRGGPSEWRKADGTPGVRKHWKDPYAIHQGQAPSAASGKD